MIPEKVITPLETNSAAPIEFTPQKGRLTPLSRRLTKTERHHRTKLVRLPLIKECIDGFVRATVLSVLHAYLGY